MNNYGYLINIPPVIAIALAVISGKYGNGEDRINKLTAEGYDANLIQKCVNELIAIFNKYGD